MFIARRTALLALTVASLAVLPAAAEWQAADRVDPDIVYRIKQEGLQRSKVMETRELPHGRVRTATHRFARNQGSRRLGAEDDARLGT